MKKNTGAKFLAAAAISGLISGVALQQGRAADTNSGVVSTNSSGGTNSPSAGKLAVVKPTVHDCAGENDCKGAGGCKTDAHDCKFKNDCKGKGGCHTTKDDIKDWEKAQKAKAKASKT